MPCGDITSLGECVTVAQRHLADVQFALVRVEEKHDEYRSRLGVEDLCFNSLEMLLYGLRSCLIDHTSLVDSV